MCGIVGLFLKDPALEPELGRLLTDMLVVMTSRGPDSAGFAVYGTGDAQHLKVTLRGARLDEVADALAGIAVAQRRDTHLVLTFVRDAEDRVRGWLALNRPDLVVTGTGRRIELYKDIGLPRAVADRFALPAMRGTHGIGHTRMATESAVTTDGAHPFSTGHDQCLVHNGSLSNHRSLRRRLEHEGLGFTTDNDSEVAAGYISWRLREGDSLTAALEAGLDDLDGFYTFVIGTENGFAVMRDPISCKPAVMAETDRYVAFGSEYRALAGLPGIETARIFEPEPARAYVWERN
jgi:glutamate synthase domain-containing protein 1